MPGKAGTRGAGEEAVAMGMVESNGAVKVKVKVKVKDKDKGQGQGQQSTKPHRHLQYADNYQRATATACTHGHLPCTHFAPPSTPL
jgi:hypothetical protein